MERVTKAQLWAQLEVVGEERVRTNLALKHYGDVGGKRALVELWLASKDQQRSEESARRNEASQSEQIDIARDAKDAAWAAADAAREAAREARKANVIATLALIAAIPAIAISVIALFLRS